MKYFSSGVFSMSKFWMSLAGRTLLGRKNESIVQYATNSFTYSEALSRLAGKLLKSKGFFKISPLLLSYSAVIYGFH